MNIFCILSILKSKINNYYCAVYQDFLPPVEMYMCSLSLNSLIVQSSPLSRPAASCYSLGMMVVSPGGAVMVTGMWMVLLLSPA